MNEVFGTISMILAVVGVLLNNRKMISCFYVWIVSNLISAYLHFDAEIYSLLVRDLIFLVLAFEGVMKWSKK